MSLDISSDIDFLREIEGLELDDVTIGTGSPMKKPPVSKLFQPSPNNTTLFSDASIIVQNNQPPQKPKKKEKKNPPPLPKLEPLTISIESTEQTTTKEEEEPKPVDIEKKEVKVEVEKPTRKKRPANHKKSKNRKPLNFDLFDFGNLQTPSVQIDTKDFCFEPSPIDALEKRITSYAEQSIKSLKEELLQEINYCMQKNDMISSIVDNFLSSFSCEIINEIQYLQPIQILDSIDISDELELTVPKIEPISSFPVSGYLSGIYFLKSKCLNGITSVTNDLSSEIQNRDLNISKTSKYEDTVSQKLRYLQAKSDSLQIIYDNLDETQKTLYKRKINLEKQKEEMENQKSMLEEKFNDIEEIRSSIEDLKHNINEQKKQLQHPSLNRLKALISHNESVLDLTKTATMSINQISNSYKYSNQYQHPNLNIVVPPRQSYSAPYSPVTPPSPISTPRRIQHFSDFPYTPHSNNESFSPVFVRQTPHYTVYSDDDDDIIPMNNCLLNKRLSDTLQSYV